MKNAVIAALASALLAGGIMQNADAADASFTYQGTIREVGGAVPSVKNKTIEFRIYDAATGDSALWGRSYAVLLDDTGLFNTALTDAAGSKIVDGDSLEKVLANNAGTTLYIGLKVQGSSGEISPRQALLAVPYAIHAADASSSSGNFTVEGSTVLKSNLEVKGSVKMPGLEVSSLTVSGDINVSKSGKVEGYGAIPVGCIVMWSGSANDIPDGWALCNGQTMHGKKTPNLCDRFIVGAGNEYLAGSTGGAKTVTLTEGQMPKHSHTTSYHVGGYSGARSKLWEVLAYDGNGEWIGWSDKSTNEKGGNEPHENRPPYYALCFIMRVK